MLKYAMEYYSSIPAEQRLKNVHNIPMPDECHLSYMPFEPVMDMVDGHAIDIAEKHLLDAGCKVFLTKAEADAAVAASNAILTAWSADGVI